MSDPAIRAKRGGALRQAMEQAGLKTPELASRVTARTDGRSITASALYAYQNGRVLLPREVGVRIAEVLRISPRELLIGDPDYAEPRDDHAEADTPPPLQMSDFDRGHAIATAENLLGAAEAIRDQLRAIACQLGTPSGSHLDSVEHLKAAQMRLSFAANLKCCQRAKDSPAYEALSQFYDSFIHAADAIQRCWLKIADTNPELRSQLEERIKGDDGAAAVLNALADTLENDIRNGHKLLKRYEQPGGRSHIRLHA